MNRRETLVRRSAVVICQLLAVYTIVQVLVREQHGRLLMAVVTPLLIMLPYGVERLLRCRIALPVYLFGLFYAIGPMLGQCHNFYYTIPWWDKMLHVFGGVMFAFGGWFLFQKFTSPQGRRQWMAALFTLCFSMAIAAAWEFCEYGADRFLGMDMQDDTVITEMRSYLLDSATGEVGELTDISRVTVNGRPLPVEGYIDIGLHDTMWDMMLETLGTVIVVGVLWLSKGRLSPFKERE